MSNCLSNLSYCEIVCLGSRVVFLGVTKKELKSLSFNIFVLSDKTVKIELPLGWWKKKNQDSFGFDIFDSDDRRVLSISLLSSSIMVELATDFKASIMALKKFDGRVDLNACVFNRDGELVFHTIPITIRKSREEVEEIIMGSLRKY